MSSEIEIFIEDAEAHWTDMESGGAAAANKRERKQAKMVANWVKAGVALDNLRSLLSNDSPRVRLAAAAYLINNGGQEEAIPVLLLLTKEPYGFVAPSAAAILRIHKIHTPIVRVD